MLGLEENAIQVLIVRLSIFEIGLLTSSKVPVFETEAQYSFRFPADCDFGCFESSANSALVPHFGAPAMTSLEDNCENNEEELNI